METGFYRSLSLTLQICKLERGAQAGRRGFRQHQLRAVAVVDQTGRPVRVGADGHVDAQLLRLGQLGAGVLTGHQVVGLAADRP